MDEGRINHSAPERPLPCRADRQKIMEQANLVLAEARLVAEQSDRTWHCSQPYGRLDAPPAAVLVLTLAGTLDAFSRREVKQVAIFYEVSRGRG
jgi:hypothetical protein